MSSLKKKKDRQDAQTYGHNDEKNRAGDDSSYNHDENSASASESNSKSGSSHTGTTEDEFNMIKEELAHHETKNVLRLRILVILLLVAVAGAVCYTIYDLTHKAEIEAFETDFDGAAESIIASLNGEYMESENCFLMKTQSRHISRTDLTSHFQTSLVAWQQLLVLLIPYQMKLRAGHL